MNGRLEHKIRNERLIEEILKINPSNIHALCEIANYLK